MGIRSKLIAFCLLLITFSTFSFNFQSRYQIENPNTISRLALSLAIARSASLKIDDYADYTIDRAAYNGHFYCDKAPGLSLLAVPIAFVALNFSDLPPQSIGRSEWKIFSIITTILIVGLISSFAGVYLFSFVYNQTRNISAAFVSLFVFACATPILGWSTLFFSHAPAASLLLIGAIRLVELKLQNRMSHQALSLIGLLFGFATTIEFPSAIAAAIILAFLLIPDDVRGLIDKAFFTRILSLGISFVVGTLPVFIYNYLIFENPLEFGYGHVDNFSAMQTGFFGFHLPNPVVTLHLLIGSYRGLIWICPPIVLIAFAYYFSKENADLARLRMLSIALFIWYLAMNSSYFYWDGGFSTGPRHMTPSLGFLCLLIGLSWPHLSSLYKSTAILIFILGAFVNFAAAHVMMLAPHGVPSPLMNYILPTFIANFPMKLLALIGLWLSFLVYHHVASKSDRAPNFT